ncbi:MAG: hypothetical protein QNL04_10070, partial [SAR324 cluster bacterium]|nr:hypothetical protein [SAR324 cluster bacterium]
QQSGTLELDNALNEISKTSEGNASAMNELSTAMAQVEITINDLAKMAEDLQEEVNYFTYNN